MTHATSLKTFALVTVTAAATTFLMQACGGSAEAQVAAPDANAIEGAWESAVTIKDCASGVVLRTFTGENIFHRGGTLSADNSMPVPTRGLGVGVWTQAATGAYTTKFHFLRFNADGTIAGSQNVVRTIALSADARSLTSTIAAQLIDPAGNVIAPICGSEVGTRLF